MTSEIENELINFVVGMVIQEVLKSMIPEITHFLKINNHIKLMIQRKNPRRYKMMEVKRSCKYGFY
jgi:hypothetical protein